MATYALIVLFYKKLNKMKTWRIFFFFKAWTENFKSRVLEGQWRKNWNLETRCWQWPRINQLHFLRARVHRLWPWLCTQRVPRSRCWRCVQGVLCNDVMIMYFCINHLCLFSHNGCGVSDLCWHCRRTVCAVKARCVFARLFSPLSYNCIFCEFVLCILSCCDEALKFKRY